MESKLLLGIPALLERISLDEFKLMDKLLLGLDKLVLFLVPVEVELVLRWFLLEKVNWNGLR
jgi:hypothetical protein